MTKKIINANEDIYISTCGTLVSYAERFKELLEKYGEDAYLDISSYSEYYPDNYVVKFHISYNREETDIEYTKRLKEEERENNRLLKEAKEKKEKAKRKKLQEFELYQKLHEKYGIK